MPQDWETFREQIGDKLAAETLANAMALALRLRMPLLGDQTAEARTIEQMTIDELHVILDQVSRIQTDPRSRFDEYLRRFFSRCNEIANEKR